MKYDKSQNLDTWTEMFSSIYESTANESKSRYEILTHLSEVTLAFGKLFFKKRDLIESKKFLTKIFSWTIALIVKVKIQKKSLEEIILTKFPKVCPYCTKPQCGCPNIKSEKINQKLLNDLYNKKSPQQSRSLNGFQTMFKTIYGHTWKADKCESGSEDFYREMTVLYLHLLEELSEVSESLRFYKIYPTNFDNEVADFLAWWFAIISCYHNAYTTNAEQEILVSELIWENFPGVCPSCLLNVCDCRPSPVRELLSKPSMSEMAYVDGLTHSLNKLKFDDDLEDILSGNLNMPKPISCIRIDLDDFKKINDNFSHDVGDKALQFFVTSIRQKIRARDRLYRLGGDEFGILCSDFSTLEAKGMLSRISNLLLENPLKEFSNKGLEEKIILTFSAGISECNVSSQISLDFTKADELAIESKKNGKNQITLI